MDNLKYLSNQVYAHASVDFIDVCETLCKELFKSMKIVKKFKEELKLANLEKEKLFVRLDESNKKNDFLRNQISSQDEKMKSLKQELVESRAKIGNLISTKPAVDNRSISVSLKPKTEKVDIPHFKMNNKEKTYFVRFDKCKSSDIDADVSKPMSKLIVREHNKSVFVPTCPLCGVIGHIRPNYFLLRQNSISETRFAVRNTDVPKFVYVCHFCGVSGHIRSNCHKLKFKHSVFQFRICDDISPTISPNKLFHMLLKNLSLSTFERNL